MTDNSAIDIEVGDGNGFSTTGERGVEARKASNAKEESVQEKRCSRCGIEKAFVWKALKNGVFLACLTFLIIQSVEFFTIYFKYPTTIETEITVAKNVKFPAITFCFRNSIFFRKFCSLEPYSCEKPRDINKFCEDHPSHCRGNTSLLKVPKQDSETIKIAQSYLVNDTFEDPSYLFATSRLRDHGTKTFIEDFDNRDLFLKCYSDNLHLYQSGRKVESRNFDYFDRDGDRLTWYIASQVNIDPFYQVEVPQMFLAIHSPFVPVVPEVDLYPIRSGTDYTIYVQLEKEEHLLPSPYQTNCMDNGPSEEAKESTNPNSFQMCLDLCRSEYFKARDGCDKGMTMISSVKDLCGC